MKKSNKIGLILCAAAFILMIIYMVFVDGVDNLTHSIERIQPFFLLLAFGCIVLYWYLEALAVHAALKAVNKEQRFKNTFLITVIGQYFNCITPCASGGQPFQAYYLTKTGTPLSSGLTALLARFIIYQLALTILSAILLISGLSFIAENSVLLFLTIIGFIINLCVIIALCILAFFRKLAIKLAHLSVRVLHKLHIVKDLDEKMKYVDNEIHQYTENFKFLKKQPLLILKMFLFSTLQLIVYFSISFVIYIGFNLTGTSFITIISCQAFVLLISSFVPLPGALGAAEGSYVAFFGAIFGGFVTLSTFIWRILTFYLPIIVGLGTTLWLNRSIAREKEKLNYLDEES